MDKKNNISVKTRPLSDVELGSKNLNPTGISFLDLILEDFKTHDSSLFNPGFIALFVHRFGNLRMSVRMRLLRMPLSLIYMILYNFVLYVFGIKLSYTVKLGRRVRIWHHGGIVLGALSIGDDVIIRHNVTMGVSRNGDPRWLKPIIEDSCEIGAGAVIVGDITVGKNCLVGANVVLSKDLPANSKAVASMPTIKKK